MGSMSKRMFGRLFVVVALGALMAGAAPAQQSASTWQQIKQRGELRIGVTPGEPWFFKDPASGQWSGIGYRMGQQIAKDLGVKLVPVETTWGNSIAAIQANQIPPRSARRRSISRTNRFFGTRKACSCVTVCRPGTGKTSIAQT
jgi:Bacterial extracellular solute-binding proteins, family 3